MKQTRAGATIAPDTAAAVIDLAAHRANLTAIRGLIGDRALMCVVKADAYGHGLTAIARSARTAGAEWLGAATPGEALALRAAGDTGRVFTWLYGLSEDLTPLVAADIDVSAHSLDHVARLVAAGKAVGRVPRVHLKIDTGLTRSGAPAADWPAVCAAAAAAERAGSLAVVGVWSHLAAADEIGHPSVPAQLAAFSDALSVATGAGLEPTLRHIANSAATLVLPEARHDLCRVGIASYGIDPAPGIAARAGIQLRPVMTLRAQLTAVKTISPGTGVSYGHTWVADRETTVGLVPLGYADGIPRHASSTADTWVNGRRAPIRGRVCMDQFVVELGPGATDRVGDEVVLFGGAPAPTAEDWADACGTIGYEIVTRIGLRVPRVVHDEVPSPAAPTQTAELTEGVSDG